MKKLFRVVVCLTVLLGIQMLVITVSNAKQVVKVRASQPEYLAAEKQIWEVFEEENPNVDIQLIAVNEPEQAAFDAKVAAGNPPVDIDCVAQPNKYIYEQYVNLLDVDFPWWGNYKYDVKGSFEEVEGIPNYAPAANPFMGYVFSFIYYKDEMDKAGLNPTENVRTMDDFWAFLAKLKEYVDNTQGIDYTLDMGWHSWCVMECMASAWSVGTGGSLEAQRELFLGKRKWDDIANNPYRGFFETLKKMYDLGYMPRDWWKRNWENEFEAGVIAHKSILTFHGPWMWTKIASAYPDAKLSGFPFPASKEGKVWAGPVSAYYNSAAMFNANKDKPNSDATLKAFNWWHSPEAVKMRAESRGEIPLYDLSSVGEAELASPQYIEVIKPLFEGYFGDWNFDTSLLGTQVAAAYQKKGTPTVLTDDALSSPTGDYLEGKVTLQELFNMLQKRWENAYPELAKK